MQIADMQPRLLVLLDSSEHNLYMLEAQLRAACPCPGYIAEVGSVVDAEAVGAIFERYGPDLIFHAAAYKHVPLMESNPFAAMQNNALGAYRLAQAALLHGPCQVVMVSTDKAANPASIMGASKRIAEIVLQTAGNAHLRMNSLRLGNVLGSQGSVAPIFLEQISRNDTVTVTHPGAERFFFTMPGALALILETAASNLQGRILVPSSLTSVKVLDLAKFLIAHCGASSGNPQITFIGLRPGEKLTEEFVAPDEKAGETIGPRLTAIDTWECPREELHCAMADLERSIRERDLRGMLQIVDRLVPSYHPSATVLAGDARVRADAHA